MVEDRYKAGTRQVKGRHKAGTSIVAFTVELVRLPAEPVTTGGAKPLTGFRLFKSYAQAVRHYAILID